MSLVEADEVSLVGHRDQGPVIDVVGPGVVLTAQGSGTSTLVPDHWGTPVLACVVEAPNLQVLAAHDKQRNPEVLKPKVGTRFRHIIGSTSQDPGLWPEVFLFQFPELVAGVATGRDVMEGREPVGGAGTGELVGDALLHSL